jgi:CheY-like chemotaxis protein
VAKILVADDNSNVQKTVALALADLDMEIVSVNNGEAAVRKLADFSPDLILADIFMPVRNGYEVCEFVKKDARFTHVPVVLLVGAFDPFDEHEAQRVGADGILKKPFVPPNPLITMIKTLLDRTVGERLIGASAPKSPVAERTGAEAIAEVDATVPEVSAELSAQEFPVPAERVAFGEGERPVAFGQLLETSGVQTAPSHAGSIDAVANEQVLTNSRDTTLGEPIFWRNDTPEVEPENGRSLITVVELETSVEKQGKDSPSTPEQTSSLEQAESLELIREEPAKTMTSVVEMDPIVADLNVPAMLDVDTGNVPELVESSTDRLTIAATEEPNAVSETVPASNEPIADAAETIDFVEPSGDFEPTVESATGGGDDAKLQVAPQCAPAPAPAQDIFQAASPNPSEPAVPDSALVEAVVQRVMDRMRPQVIDIITKEVLRPVVLALVHREIGKH